MKHEKRDRINRKDRIVGEMAGGSGDTSAHARVRPQSAGDAGKSGRSATASTIFGQRSRGGQIYPT